MMGNQQLQGCELAEAGITAAKKAFAAWKNTTPQYTFPLVTTLDDLKYHLFAIVTWITEYRQGKADLNLNQLCDRVLAVMGYALA